MYLIKANSRNQDFSVTIMMVKGFKGKCDIFAEILDQLFGSPLKCEKPCTSPVLENLDVHGCLVSRAWLTTEALSALVTCSTSHIWSRMMSRSLEEAIRIAYASFPDAVEPILTTQTLRFQFLTRVSDLCPGKSEDAVLQCLVRLRKRGENKGGLPRKSDRKANSPH